MKAATFLLTIALAFPSLATAQKESKAWHPASAIYYNSKSWDSGEVFVPLFNMVYAVPLHHFVEMAAIGTCQNVLLVAGRPMHWRWSRLRWDKPVFGPLAQSESLAFRYRDRKGRTIRLKLLQEPGQREVDADVFKVLDWTGVKEDLAAPQLLKLIPVCKENTLVGRVAQRIRSRETDQSAKPAAAVQHP